MSHPPRKPGDDSAEDPLPGSEGATLPETWTHMARSSYNAPGDTPREEIWRGIESTLLAEVTPTSPSAPARRRRPWVPLLAAATVALLLGVGVAQWSVAPPQHAEAPGPASASGEVGSRVSFAASPSVRYATRRHLSDVEALLALVHVDARQGRVDPTVGLRGRELLTRTRLLLDSPVAREASVREVLEDLELVLAQVALLADAGGASERLRSELQLIAGGVAEGGVRSRLRAVMPSFDHLPLAADD